MARRMMSDSELSDLDSSALFGAQPVDLSQDTSAAPKSGKSEASAAPPGKTAKRTPVRELFNREEWEQPWMPDWEDMPPLVPEPPLSPHEQMLEEQRIEAAASARVEAALPEVDPLNLDERRTHTRLTKQNLLVERQMKTLIESVAGGTSPEHIHKLEEQLANDPDYLAFDPQRWLSELFTAQELRHPTDKKTVPLHSELLPTSAYTMSHKVSAIEPFFDPVHLQELIAQYKAGKLSDETLTHYIIELEAQGRISEKQLLEFERQSTHNPNPEVGFSAVLPRTIVAAEDPLTDDDVVSDDEDVLLSAIKDYEGISGSDSSDDDDADDDEDDEYDYFDSDDEDDDDDDDDEDVEVDEDEDEEEYEDAGEGEDEDEEAVDEYEEGDDDEDGNNEEFVEDEYEYDEDEDEDDDDDDGDNSEEDEEGNARIYDETDERIEAFDEEDMDDKLSEMIEPRRIMLDSSDDLGKLFKSDNMLADQSDGEVYERPARAAAAASSSRQRGRVGEKNKQKNKKTKVSAKSLIYSDDDLSGEDEDDRAFANGGDSDEGDADAAEYNDDDVDYDDDDLLLPDEEPYPDDNSDADIDLDELAEAEADAYEPNGEDNDGEGRRVPSWRWRPSSYGDAYAPIPGMEPMGMYAQSLRHSAKLMHNIPTAQRKFIETEGFEDEISDTEPVEENPDGFDSDPLGRMTLLNQIESGDMTAMDLRKGLIANLNMNEAKLHSSLTEEDSNDGPIIAYSEAMQLATGGRRPLLKDSSKEALYEAHRSDPNTWTVARLAQKYGLRQARVRAIIRMKAVEKAIEASRPELLTPELQDAMEKETGAVDDFHEPDLADSEVINLRDSAPTSPLFGFIDGAADRKKAAAAYWSSGKQQRRKWVPPEQIPRTPTPKTPPPQQLDPGLIAGFANPKRRVVYANWNPDVHPLEEFAVVRETDGTLRTPTFEERLRWLFLPMFNLLPDSWRRPENAVRVDAPAPGPHYDGSPGDYIGARRDYREVEDTLRAYSELSKTEGMYLDEGIQKIIDGEDQLHRLRVNELAAESLQDGDVPTDSWRPGRGYSLDEDVDEFMQQMHKKQTLEELQAEHDALESAASSDGLPGDDLIPGMDLIHGVKNKGFVNWQEHFKKKVDQDPLGNTPLNKRRGPPPVPDWLTRRG